MEGQLRSYSLPLVSCSLGLGLGSYLLPASSSLVASRLTSSKDDLLLRFFFSTHKYGVTNPWGDDDGGGNDDEGDGCYRLNVCVPFKFMY